jgi:hypothetical protein
MKLRWPERGRMTPTLSFWDWARTMPNGENADAAARAAAACVGR